MRRYFCAALLFAILNSASAPAVDKDGNFVVIGPATCGDWHEDSRGRDFASRQRRELHAAWLEGYISGVNSQAVNKDVRVAGPQIRTYTDRYCANNPLHSLVSAANALIDEAGGPRAEHTWKK
jgi:hypothetical protein